MRRIKYKKNKKLTSQTLEYAGAFPHVPIAMQLFVYDEDTFEEYNDLSLSEIEEVLKKAKPTAIKWFNLHGLHDIALLKAIGDFFAIEQYIMIEILNLSRRTRVEEVDNALFFSVKAILPSAEEEEGMPIEQISFILQSNILLSFQEKKGDFFTMIRERIRTKTGQVRKRDASYLLYALLDSLSDSFFTTLDVLEDHVEQVLVDAKSRYEKGILVRIEEHTQDLHDIKRAIIPFREAVNNVKIRLDNKDKAEEIISKSSLMFFARLQYKSVELLDQIEYNLNKLDSATNYFFSAQSNRMNEVMKVLTIVSVVFIPLTFIAGVYGMNFDNMPELNNPNGYYYTLVGMFILLVLMLVYFKWRKWF